MKNAYIELSVFELSSLLNVLNNVKISEINERDLKVLNDFKKQGNLTINKALKDELNRLEMEELKL